jgi:hypothetical protein
MAEVLGPIAKVLASMAVFFYPIAVVIAHIAEILGPLAEVFKPMAEVCTRPTPSAASLLLTYHSQVDMDCLTNLKLTRVDQTFSSWHADTVNFGATSSTLTRKREPGRTKSGSGRSRGHLLVMGHLAQCEGLGLGLGSGFEI